MLKSISNHRIFFNFILIYSLFYSCVSNENKVLNRNAKIDEIFNAYDTVKTKKGIQQNFEYFQNSKDENARLFNEITAIYRENWDNQKIREKMDSIIRKAEENDIPELMEFYLCFYLMNVELYHRDPKRAYQLYLKSLQAVEEYPSLFSKQTELSEDWNNLILKSYYKTTNYFYESFKEDLENVPFNESKNFYLHYNLAVYEQMLGFYEKSNKSIHRFYEIYKSPSSNKLFSDALALSAGNYAYLGKYDSLRIIDNKALDYFQKNEFTINEYYNYLFQSLKVAFYTLNQNDLEERIRLLKEFYEYDCNNSYVYTAILEAESKFYHFLNDIDKEFMVLEKEKELIEECGIMDDYRMKEKNRILLRLTKIALQREDYASFQNRYKDLENLDSTEKKIKNDYIEFTQFLSYRDLQLSQQNFEKYKEDVQNENKVYRLYILSIGLFVVLAIFLVILYCKNLKNQKNINEKNKQIKIQNKTEINQNRNLREVISSLEESNRDLNNFARVAAHDIKSPIATIKNGIDYLQDYYREDIREEDILYFENLKTKTEDLVEMIDELLGKND